MRERVRPLPAPGCTSVACPASQRPIQCPIAYLPSPSHPHILSPSTPLKVCRPERRWRRSTASGRIPVTHTRVLSQSRVKSFLVAFMLLESCLRRVEQRTDSYPSCPQMPKESTTASKARVLRFITRSVPCANKVCFVSCRRPKMSRSLPKARRTLARLNGLCPPLCSSLKIGERGSRLRTLMPVSVCARHSIRFDLFVLITKKTLYHV